MAPESHGRITSGGATGDGVARTTLTNLLKPETSAETNIPPAARLEGTYNSAVD